MDVVAEVGADKQATAVVQPGESALDDLAVAADSDRLVPYSPSVAFARRHGMGARAVLRGGLRVRPMGRSRIPSPHDNRERNMPDVGSP